MERSQGIARPASNCAAIRAMTTLMEGKTSPSVTRREVWGWCMYDFADSAFTTVIVTTLYALYYKKIVVADDQRGDLLWGLAASVSEIAVALLAPVLGAIADFSGSRKRFLAACAVAVILFTASLHFIGPGMAALGFVLYILANIGFTGGGIFIDSFLPGISNERNAGRISGMKWGLGYLGGLLALVVCGGLAVNIVRDPTAEQVDRARLIPLIIAAWYGLAVIPTFLFLRDRSVARPLPAGENYVTLGFRQLWRTLKQVRRYRELFKLLLAFVVYNDGIVTVITFAALYAEQTIGFTPAEIVTMFIIMNVVALVGAGTFGWIADWIGQKRTILISLGLWILAIVAAYFAQTKTAFYAVAVLAGIGMGSCQSVTRSLVALFTPKPNAAEFAGFLGFAGKAVAFLGPLLFGIISHQTGSQRPAILSVGLFFVVGMLLLLMVDEAKGKAASRLPVGEG
jgi:MFS transporter, UMF1 family